MPNVAMMALAAAPMVEIIRNIKPDQLGEPTPCAEYDVRKLNHLLYWQPSLAGAGRKETVPPPVQPETELDLTEGDWAAALEAHVARTVEAWSRPAAWTGTTRMAGPTEMPAPMIGGMIVGELVVHGWDLARATGQDPTWDDDFMAYVHGELTQTAELGREMGVYGPRVEVPASASTLDRVLALTGRDPAWTVAPAGGRAG